MEANWPPNHRRRGGLWHFVTTHRRSVAFRHVKNPIDGNLAEDARCWQRPPSTTSDVTVVILNPSPTSS